MQENELPKELVEETEKASTEGPQYESLYNQVLNMSVAEKLRLASVGNRQARSLLIKDAQITVVEAVLNNPQLSEDEVIRFAENRNLVKEVVQSISNKRKFLKAYGVKKALIGNPKTPLAVTVKLLDHLRDRDLKAVASSRNVPGVLTNAAKNILLKRVRK